MIFRNIANRKIQFDQRNDDTYELYGSIALYQVGDIICDSGYIIRDHKQICCEISYIADGKGKFKVGNSTYNVKKDDIVICRTDQLHAIISDNADPLRYYYLGFVFDDEHLTDNMKIIKDFFLSAQAFTAAGNMKIQTPFHTIFNEFINNSPFSKNIIKNSIEDILIYTYRYFNKTDEEIYLLDNEIEGTNSIIYEIVNYIDSHITEIEDLSEIGKVFGYNYSYLSRIFSSTFGYSIKTYYTKCRFAAAAKMLGEGKYSITDIADKLKYQSVHSFSRAFKLYYGISPSEFKQKN